MELYKTLVVMLALFLAVTVIMPAGSAEMTTSTASPEVDAYMEWAYTMEGKEVPVSQILEKRNPEFWSNLSQDQKNVYSKLKTMIPNYHQFSQTTEKEFATATATGKSSGNDKIASSLEVIIYTADAYSATTAIPGAINYWAGTTTNYPCPWSLVIADLMRWDGSKWVRQKEKTAESYYTTFTEAWDNSILPPSGYYYSTYSQHFGDFPPGAVPPAWTLARWSNTMYYTWTFFFSKTETWIPFIRGGEKDHRFLHSGGIVLLH
ncbi:MULTISPECIES: hypothetical protein [unclassified Methanoregula]|uniref:hypothetical protein n=1 Tax=unclassified Methanoregula TaxID=2649730 RepID=UPI0009C581D5|nr:MULTISPECIES: hypothetical protein [unclassified Methanoregula]OPX65172.1 MAG: hypothetical protein A4E33_00203 [Methanoregula sp. PtaB.Bin085]OPY32084.1 MAG: hypothetical protein A4E34_02456 [Methanoregula sp. PtaU1.Bin006]